MFAQSILEQLPNGGAVVAVIAVVIIFLKATKEIVAAFTADTAASRKEYIEHTAEIMRLGLDAHRETRSAIHSLDNTIKGIRDDPARNLP